MSFTGSNTHNNGNPAGDGQAGDADKGTKVKIMVLSVSILFTCLSQVRIVTTLSSYLSQTLTIQPLMRKHNVERHFCFVKVLHGP